MNLKDCHNVEDFTKLAKKKLPAPIFHYIDGGADDEITLKKIKYNSNEKFKEGLFNFISLPFIFMY